MTTLVRNELVKLLTKKRIAITLLILLAFILLSALMTRGEYSINNWRAEAESRIHDSREYIEELQSSLTPDNQELITYEQQYIAKLEYGLENNVPFFITTPLDFVHEAFSAKYILIILMIVISSYMICNEYSSKMAEVLIVRGIHQSSIIISKILSVLLVSVILELLYSVLSFIVGVLFFGENGLIGTELFINKSGEIYTVSSVEIIMKTMVLVAVEVLLYSSIALLLSVIVKNQTVAVVGSVFFWLLRGMLPFTATKIRVDYLLTTCLDELNLYFTSPVSPATVGKTIGIIIAYCICFCMISVFVFVRKPYKMRS